MWKNCIAWFAHQTKGFSIFVGTTLTIVDIITIQFSRWTWLHHHLIQFAKKKGHHLQLLLVDFYFHDMVQMKKHL
jgi:hypothetical protein